MVEPFKLFDSRRTPRPWADYAAPGVTVKALSGWSAVQVFHRSLPASAADDLARVIRGPLPKPNQLSTAPGRLVVWETPSSFSILSQEPDSSSFAIDLATALGQTTGLVLETTDRLFLLEIGGDHRLSLIQRGCAFEPRRLRPGVAVRVRFAGVTAGLLRPSDDGPVLLTSDAVHAPFLNDWFRRALSTFTPEA